MKAEASEKICRALKHPVRASEEIFNNGDKVISSTEESFESINSFMISNKKNSIFSRVN